MVEILETDELQFLTGSPTPNAFPYPQNSHTGQILGMYGDLFYNNIQVSPVAIDVGNLTTQQQHTITVFNAYLETKTLEQIFAVDAEGIVLTGPSRPLNILPLSDVVFTLTVTLDGPPTINAVYTFDFTGTVDDKTVTVTGSRIVAFPFYFNTQAKEIFKWTTSVLTANDGTEQRQKLLEVPRQRFESNAVMQIVDRILADNLLYGWRHRSWALPLWQEARLYSGTIAQSATLINIDTTNASFTQTGLVMVWQNTMKFDVFIIANLTDTSITLDRPTETAFTNPVITPVSLSRLNTNPERLTNGYNGSISVLFESTDNNILPDPDTITTFNGYDVAEFDALLTGEFIRDQYEQRVEFIDYETGPIETYTPWLNTKTIRSFRIVLEGQDEIWEFKRWLHRRSGKWRPFWLQNYESGFRLIDKGFVGGTFTSQDDGQATQGASRGQIAAVLKNGTIIYSNILTKNINQDGEVVISLDVPINSNFEDIDYITTLGLKRLASDTITITRLANNVAECILPIIEIDP